MKTRFQTPERAIRLLFWAFTLICLIAAVLMPDRAEMPCAHLYAVRPDGQELL